MQTTHNLCPKFEHAFSLLGKRWTGLIINVLLDGPKRFKDISVMIPNMSDRMLAERFKELEAEGILVRHVYPETPVRIEYELTEKGRALEPVMKAVQTWGETWVNIPAHQDY
ncbi:winged helix-turn-helix transcriptional regulator [Alicyclobacillus tolerans]|uniref:DNA-binding HxlR family transcriptional regulator n=2 Tax=Alicyclobacillus tolerans TaxID=90970 RepID=A0ABT9LT24_9BACL|nr:MULTISPECIES: helix-turn-helix domain-containing protein [Alicyclobacillus]MDP9727422.1 DNA-binding HxlR family transcriptional regulator [Alicyclobacillus tengchongensis]QRF23148.1 helix-turn-helix transcriptional regulator [Alicyclobacillus sp. TC]SHJ49275.1 transcriptional regulator, HxlR family [Alicyclobacillus montanus]